MVNKTIVFKPMSTEVPFSNEANVLEVALKHKIKISHSCGGMGSCTTCRVFVESSLTDLSARTDLELEITESRGFAANERLSCQLEPCPGLIVRIPEDRTAES